MAEQAEGKEGEGEDKEYDCGTVLVCIPVVLASSSPSFLSPFSHSLCHGPNCSERMRSGYLLKFKLLCRLHYHPPVLPGVPTCLLHGAGMSE